MPRRGSDLLFALLVLLALVLTLVTGLVLSGRLVSDPAHSDQAAPPPAAATRPRDSTDPNTTGCDHAVDAEGGQRANCRHTG